MHRTPPRPPELTQPVEPGGPPPPPEPWVTLAEICKHLGVSRPTVMKFLESGRIPGRNFGNGKRAFWKFKRSAVDAALAQETHSPSVRKQS